MKENYYLRALVELARGKRDREKGIVTVWGVGWKVKWELDMEGVLVYSVKLVNSDVELLHVLGEDICTAIEAEIEKGELK